MKRTRQGLSRPSPINQNTSQVVYPLWRTSWRNCSFVAFIFILGNSLLHFASPSSTFVFRFHEEIKKSLERRRADVVELSQNLTERMADIHHALIQCMSITLSELKRSNTTVSCICATTIYLLPPPNISVLAWPRRFQCRKCVLSVIRNYRSSPIRSSVA